MDEATREAMAPVLGQIPSGLFILTAADGTGNETGLLASWVQQASFDPPVVTVAVNAKRYLNDWLAASPKLALCLLAETQKEMLGHFGRGFDADQPAFEGLEIERTHNNLPALKDSLGYVEGDVVNHVTAGDHVIYFVELTGAGPGTRSDDEKPYVHIRKNGFGY